MKTVERNGHRETPGRSCNEHRFLRWSLWLPLALPVGFWIPFFLVNRLGWTTPVGINQLAAVLAYSLVLGGIPYTVFAIWAFVHLRSRSVADAIRLSLKAPLIAAALMVACMFLVVVWYEGIAGAVSAGLFLSLYVVAFGYAYVGLVHGVRVILKRCGFIVSGCTEGSA